MSISSTARKAGPFFGNGVATDFSFDFKLFRTEELRVVRLDGPTGLEVDLVEGVDYDAGLNADQDENPGGGITLRAALANGDRVTLVSAVPELQPVDLTNQGGFYPDLLNGGLDRATILVQQLKEASDRSLKLPVSSTAAQLTLPLPQGNQLLTWNGDGSALVNRDPGELISVVTYGSTRADIFDGNGTQTSFVLSASPGSVNNMQIAINGVMQVPGVDYTWGGGVALSFTTAPPAGTKVFVRYQEALNEGTDVSGKADKTGANLTDDDAALFRARLGSGGINRGNWNAELNEPEIVSGAGVEGDFYTVTTAGSTSIDGAGPWNLGDQLLFKSGLWTRIPSLSAYGTNKGAWNATTNIPALVSGTGATGDFYTVTVSGTTALDGFSTWKVGDQVLFVGGVWTRVQAPLLAIDGSNIPPNVGVGPSGAFVLRKSQNLFFVTPEDFGGKANDPIFDNTDAITRAETYLKALPEGGALVFGEGRDYYFKSTIGGARNRLVWRGSRTRLIYNGVNTTRNLVVIGDNVSQYREMDVSGIEVCSLTVMAAGCAVWAPLACRSNFRFDNIQGQDFAEANGNNLWNGFWADKVDNIEIHSDNINARNECVIVNGAISGPKADCWLHVGKISGASVGIHMAGAFGGLYITPDTTMIHNKVNLLVDRAITAEGNRELFATGAIFDVAEGSNLGSDANIIINDNGGLRLNFTGCWISAGASHAFWVKALQGVLCISGCRIIQHLGDGFRTSVAGSGFTLITGCQITGMGGWGVNGLVDGYAVAIGACEIGANTLGDINPAKVNASRSTNGAARFIGPVNATEVNIDATAIWRMQSGNPRLIFDAGDYLGFDRATNAFGFFIGGQEAAAIKPGYVKAINSGYYAPATRIIGTANGSGVITAPHSDSSLPRRIKTVHAFWAAADGTVWEITGAANVTGSYISFQAHAPAAGRPFVVTYEYYESAW